jgi:DNA-binding MarR family transcriptional regulator
MKGKGMNMRKKSFGHYISVIYRHLQIHLNREFTVFGFGSGQYLFFLHIAKNEGVTQKKISCHLAIDKATTAKAIKKLGELGYIRGEQDIQDRRSYKLYLTDKGKRIKPEVKKILQNTMTILSKGLSEEEKSATWSILETFLSNITTYTEDNRSEN